MTETTGLCILLLPLMNVPRKPPPSSAGNSSDEVTQNRNVCGKSFKTEQKREPAAAMKDNQKKAGACLCFLLDEKLTPGITEGETEVKKQAQRTLPACVSLFGETLPCSVMFISRVHPQRSKMLSAVRLPPTSYMLLTEDRPQGRS